MNYNFGFYLLFMKNTKILITSSECYQKLVDLGTSER